jgi:small-conductance mechanosensitive channel
MPIVMLQEFSNEIQSKLSEIGGELSFAPAWFVSFVILVAAFVVAWLIHSGILALVRHLLGGRRPYVETVVEATKNPTRFALLILALAIALPTTPLSGDMKGILGRILGLASIGWVGWIAFTILHIASDLYLRQFRLDAADNLLARKHVTQVRVLLRTMDTVIVVLTLGIALMTFDAVRQYGVSLFASAGIAGVVFGLAAQPVLSNLIAGVQLAVTQPIRLEDAVTVENEYGWIEEITATYVVVRLWDLRRLIVPLNYFIQKPFYNWTRQATANIGYVLLYLDYTAPIDRIREKAMEFAAQSKITGTVVNVQVTNTSAQAIEVRILLTAHNPSTTSDLCAELREKLIGFLQREYPESLPRRRNEVIEPQNRNKNEPPPLRPPAPSA